MVSHYCTCAEPVWNFFPSYQPERRWEAQNPVTSGKSAEKNAREKPGKRAEQQLPWTRSLWWRRWRSGTEFVGHKEKVQEKAGGRLVYKNLFACLMKDKKSVNNGFILVKQYLTTVWLEIVRSEKA